MDWKLTVLPDTFGALQTADIPDPGRGNMVTIQPPEHERWLLYGITAQLGAGLGGANRRFYWLINTPLNPAFLLKAVGQQPQNTTYNWSWSNANFPLAAIPSWNPLHLVNCDQLPPPLFLVHSTPLISFVANWNPFDTIRNVTIFYESWVF